MSNLPERFLLELSKEEVLFLAHLNGFFQAAFFENIPAMYHSYSALTKRTDVWDTGLSPKMKALFDAAGLVPVSTYK